MSHLKYVTNVKKENFFVLVGRAIAKCRKVGAANYGKGGKKAKKKAEGGLIEMKNGGSVPKQTRKRKTKNPNIARGCGVVMSNRRKVTKFR